MAAALEGWAFAARDRRGLRGDRPLQPRNQAWALATTQGILGHRDPPYSSPHFRRYGWSPTHMVAGAGRWLPQLGLWQKVALPHDLLRSQTAGPTIAPRSERPPR